ncbi:MAG: hypothetical protein KBG29_03145 [Pseudomonadales bacterium]|jgi:hypothetical protein|nr:hypothetical protein [Pseudomonadales bacterium]
MAILKAGTRMRSAVCKTEVMVIVAPAADVALTCGGAPMIPSAETPPAGAVPAPGSAGGSLLGKRYVNAAGNLELLCVKPGDGSLAADGESLVLKEAKPLPSSD